MHISDTTCILAILKTRCGCSRKVKLPANKMDWYLPCKPKIQAYASVQDDPNMAAVNESRRFSRTGRTEKHDDLTFVVFEEQ